MRHNYCVEYNGVRIRPICFEDLENLRVWRNNPNNARYLKQIKEITPKAQQEWYKQYLDDDNIITFAIDEIRELNRMVGSVSIYDFCGNHSNCGKTMIGDLNARGRNLGGRGEILALHTGFQKMGFSYYITEVNKDNTASNKMTSDYMGFTKAWERSIHDITENLYIITKDEFYMRHPYLKDLKIEEY